MLLIIVELMIVNVVGSVATRPLQISSTHLNYLSRFGYFNTNSKIGSLGTKATLEEAVKRFQRYSGIPETGEVDDATIRQFSTPRCGVKDINTSDDDPSSRNKRYTNRGLFWHKKLLTYRIENWTNDLSRSDIRNTVRKALTKWEQASNLKFRQKSRGTADIMIRFVRKEHNDAYAFDGPGGTLAHAFFPGRNPLAGDTHFDDDETFTLRNRHGKDFYWVALHEFGHSIGLDHSTIKGTVMFPFYHGYKGKDVELSEDDIKGIQSMYGVPKNYNRPKVVTQDRPNFNRPAPQCINQVHSITTNTRTGETVIVNGDQIYIHDSHLLKRRKGPLSISEYFRDNKLCDVDASYTLPNGNTVFLQGKSSFEYKGRNTVRSDFLLSRRGFPDDLHNIDAAFYWKKARKVYIFKGTQYWRYNPWKREVDKGYPKTIQGLWHGIPDHIDGVFEWKKKIFFFKDDEYYRFDEEHYKVLKGYPRKINKFFECEKNNKKVIRQVSFRKEQLRGGLSANHAYHIQSFSKLFHSIFTLFTISLIYGQFF